MRIASLSLLVVLSTVSCCLFGQAPATEETGPPLSLGDALRQALNRNYLVESSRIDSEVSAQAVRGTAGVYDPRLTARYNYENTNLLGEPRDEELASASTGIEGLLPFGGTYRIGYQVEDRTSLQFDLFSTDPGYRWQDRVTAHLGAEFTQPLLRGFLANDAQTNLLVARRRHEQSLEGFRADVITTVTNTIQAYHDLYFAQRNLAIAERNRANAQQLLEDNRRRVEAGAMAPLDIYQAESEAAVRESAVISARRLRRSAENRLKGLIFNDPSKVLEARFSVPALPAPSPVQVNPVDDREIALNRRPDYLNAVVEEDIRENQLKSDRWAARPQLDLVASAGRYTDSGTLGRSNSELAERGDDQVSVGLVFSYPLFNRTNDARRVSSLLRRNQATLLKRQLEQRILLELDDAAEGVHAAWQRVEVTRHARELAEKSLEAEEKKLRIGTSSTFVVLRLQGDLANAQIRETSAVVEYFTAIAAYEQARGTTLEAYGLILR